MQPLFPLNNIGVLSGVCSRQQTQLNVVLRIIASSDSLLFDHLLKRVVPLMLRAHADIWSSYAQTNKAGVFL